MLYVVVYSNIIQMLGDDALYFSTQAVVEHAVSSLVLLQSRKEVLSIVICFAVVIYTVHPLCLYLFR